MGSLPNVTELAKMLGVSPASVSRALNGKPGLNTELRSRILSEASRLNVSLNGAARSLSTSQTNTVCFAVHHLASPLSADPFYGEISHGLQQELRAQGYQVLVSTLTDAEVAEPDTWAVVRERRVDGVVLASPFIPARFILALVTRNVPVILVDNALENVQVDVVVGDDRGGACKVAEHVLKLGHQRIVILSGPKDWFTNNARCAGFRDALANRGLEPVAELHAEATTIQAGRELMAAALKHRPTAVLTINDAMAMGAINAAASLGVRIPDDLTITGFDDIDLAKDWSVPLTTVRQFKQHLGRAAGRQLLARIAEPEGPHQRITLETELMVRASSGPVPKSAAKSPAKSAPKIRGGRS